MENARGPLLSKYASCTCYDEYCKHACTWRTRGNQTPSLIAMYRRYSYSFQPRGYSRHATYTSSVRNLRQPCQPKRRRQPNRGGPPCSHSLVNEIVSAAAPLYTQSIPLAAPGIRDGRCDAAAVHQRPGVSDHYAVVDAEAGDAHRQRDAVDSSTRAGAHGARGASIPLVRRVQPPIRPLLHHLAHHFL